MAILYYKANIEQSKLQDKIHNINKKNKGDDGFDDNADSAEEFDRRMKENIRQQQESMKLKKESKSTQLSKSLVDFLKFLSINSMIY